MKTQIFLALATALTVCVAPRSLAADDEKKVPSASDTGKAVELIAILRPTEGNTTAGSVRFQPLEGNKVEVVATVTGLKPGSKHGIHIHQYGDLSAEDGTSLGGHYNPLDHKHGLPSQESRHAGDFGNLEADASGVGVLKLVVDNLSLTGQKNPILGRGVVIHEKADDGGQPTGNAGARIAVGVIGIRNPDNKSES